jgi:hypothetical protein
VNVNPDPDKPRPPREFWFTPQLRPALAERDFTAIYRMLRRYGYTQHQLSVLTGHSQPQVSATVNGRPVMAYQVMKRVADGLGIPPCLLGMATCADRCPRDGEP